MHITPLTITLLGTAIVLTLAGASLAAVCVLAGLAVLLELLLAVAAYDGGDD